MTSFPEQIQVDGTTVIRIDKSEDRKIDVAKYPIDSTHYIEVDKHLLSNAYRSGFNLDTAGGAPASFIAKTGAALGAAVGAAAGAMGLGGFVPGSKPAPAPAPKAAITIYPDDGKTQPLGVASLYKYIGRASV